MKRFLFLLGAIGALGCGRGSTEPGFSGGTFTLAAVNGNIYGGKVDESIHCTNVYETGWYLTLGGNGKGVASLHLRTFDYCTGSSSSDNLFEDTGSFATTGDSIALTFTRAGSGYRGSISADRDTLNILFRDVWNPQLPATALFTFVRNR